LFTRNFRAFLHDIYCKNLIGNSCIEVTQTTTIDEKAKSM